jgi:hypothetical protein
MARSPYRLTRAPHPRSVSSRTNANAETSNPTASYPTWKDRAYSGRTGERIPYPSKVTNVPNTTTRMSRMRRMSR